jgi:CSLREA domain-containing protein
MRQIVALALVVSGRVGLGGAHAATLTPDTTADEFDPVADGDCSLREAVESANRDADFGGCLGVGAYGDDVIVLAAAVYTLDRPPGSELELGYDNAGGDLDLPDLGAFTRTEIHGAGMDATIVERADTAEAFRIFQVGRPHAARFVDLTICNGRGVAGGGIWAEAYELELERVAVRDNAVGGRDTVGGGVATLASRLRIVDSLFADNRLTARDHVAVTFDQG